MNLYNLSNIPQKTSQFNFNYNHSLDLKTREELTLLKKQLESLFLKNPSTYNIVTIHTNHSNKYYWPTEANRNVNNNSSFFFCIMYYSYYQENFFQDKLPTILDAKLVKVDDYLRIGILIEVEGLQVPIVATFEAMKNIFGCKIFPKYFLIQGKKYEFDFAQMLENKNNFNWNDIREFNAKLKMEYDELQEVIKNHLEKCEYNTSETLGNKGITKALAKIQEYLHELKIKYPLEYFVLVATTQVINKSVNSVSCSKVFNAEMESVKSVEDLKDKYTSFIKTCLSKNRYYRYYAESESLEWFEQAQCFLEFRKASLKSNNTRAFNKLMEDFDFLNLNIEKYPKTHQAILAGDIPISTFFRKKEQYFLLNDNFDLWEEMLDKYYDVASELAKAVSTRTTYEKDLMSYFFFVLYELPEYLENQTGEKWTCSPKLVNSPNELDPPKEDDNSGIIRKRSALTPIVDNENHTVVVPYASLALHGAQTTYCYSHDYHILRRGFSFNGNTVIKDVEEKLNGRDDYGLMFYTFTGSPNGRGYPTFLIIFERRSTGTHVHFHRTHPCRSKDGDYNPIHNWVKVCYNWMIGNVPKDNIVAQQGDLAFIKADLSKKEFNDKVSYYDNHEFDVPVLFNGDVPAKQNILGYFRLTTPTMLNHHEHENILIPAGDYELRQCRSWEANPKSVWVLRID